MPSRVEAYDVPMAEMKTVHLRIIGRVQGVCFRAWTKEHARRLGLAGFVRNTDDGSVEAVFSGAAKDVDAMTGLCGAGPNAARVDHVEVLALADGAQSGDFRIEY